MRVTFLGTGTSRGIPVVGCRCLVCRSEDPRNRRLRSSILLEIGEVIAVVDTSSDFRQQMLRADVPRLDAVVLTHHHVDHVLGLDDVYPFCVQSGRNLPLYGSTPTLEEVRQTFRHLFVGNPGHRSARLDPREINGPFPVGASLFEPVEAWHGTLPVLGYRVGSFAYMTDVNHIPPASFARLRNLDILVLDGLRLRRHPTHFSIPEAVEVARQLRPRETYLIHMCHEVDHAETDGQLPKGIRLAYDGLILDC
jgi:phosphoribosyl 1,2-cyclic phosphate phosphodiesterase